jgi:phosphohistidine phosphatase
MEIWLLRHAEAEDRASSGRDADRALTEDGEDRARKVARGLSTLKPSIDAIWSSPYRRARQTAEPAARELGLELSETRALEPDRDPEEVLEELRHGGAESVLLVGHEPHMGALLGTLVAGRDGPAMPMKKAAVARLVWDGRGRAALKALLPPKVLEAMGRKA